MAKRQGDLRKWALIGAEQRLIQLAEEAAAIHREFPELRQRKRASATPATPSPNRGGRRRRKMSADARKRISEAQKARWAKTRARKG